MPKSFQLSQIRHRRTNHWTFSVRKMIKLIPMYRSWQKKRKLETSRRLITLSISTIFITRMATRITSKESLWWERKAVQTTIASKAESTVSKRGLHPQGVIITMLTMEVKLQTSKYLNSKNQLVLWSLTGLASNRPINYKCRSRVLMNIIQLYLCLMKVMARPII